MSFDWFMIFTKVFEIKRYKTINPLISLLKNIFLALFDFTNGKKPS